MIWREIAWNCTNRKLHFFRDQLHNGADWRVAGGQGSHHAGMCEPVEQVVDVGAVARLVVCGDS